MNREIRRRRVKCGEERPSCKRCISLKLTCPGYPEPYIFMSTPKQYAIVKHLTTARPSREPDLSQTEHLAFEFFRLHILNDGQDELLESSLWHNHILRVAVEDSILRYAIMALGALGQLDLIAHPQAVRHLSWKCYDQAVVQLSRKISHNGVGDIQVTLVVCILFAIFELRQQAWDKTRHHILGGLAIMQNDTGLLHNGAPVTSQDLISRPLLRAFRRLGNQMLIYFGGLGQNHHLVDSAATERTLPNFKSFNTLSGAQKSLTVIGVATRELASRARSGEQESDDLAIAHRELIQASNQWEADMQTLTLTLSASQERQTARVMEVHYLSGRIKAEMILTNGNEMLWDEYYSTFLRICQLGVTIIGEENNRVAPFSSFFLDAGVLMSLHFVAHRCRDPELRRVAIGLLQQCEHQEGALSGRLLAEAAEAIMLEEERGLLNVGSARDVPESHRIREAFFDLQAGPDVGTAYNPDRYATRQGADDALVASVQLPRAVRNAYCSLL